MGHRVGVEQRGREETSHTFSGSLGKHMSNHHTHPSPPFASLTSLRTLMGEFQRDITQPVKEQKSFCSAMMHFTENLHFSGTSSTKPTEPEVRPVSSMPEAAVPTSALSGKHSAICCSFLPEMSWQPPCVSDGGNPPCWRDRQGQGLDKDKAAKEP